MSSDPSEASAIGRRESAAGVSPGLTNPNQHPPAIDLIEAARLTVQRALQLEDDSGGSENSESSESSESSENSESSESSEGKESCESFMYRAIMLADPAPDEWGALLTGVERATREVLQGRP